MAIDKTLRDYVPHDLLETLEELRKFPRSRRLANEFFNTGLNLMKENDLYHPFTQYQTQLRYHPQDNSTSAVLTYRVISRIRGRDRIFLAFPFPEEVKLFEVYRSRSWSNLFNGSSPYGFGIHLLNPDGSPKELSTYYALEGSFN
ncbi:hypothetical protein HY212_01335 [Candidatus Pacearchaeota archaeon]|nr:hypothetical protein [Candidatus Pacearchaeota archaeon]